MKIPLVDLRTQYFSIKEEIDQAISNVIEESDFIGGKYTKDFEENFANYIGVKYCIGVGNGTDALCIALKSLGVSANDEVITAANTFIATSEAITMTGSKVVFVDCDKDNFNIDADKIESVISPETKAIIPVHLYGQPAEMDRIKDIAGEHDLFIIEDAAQAHGAAYKGENVGTFGDIACFSFYPGKNLGAYGDAGAVLTNNYELAEKVRMMANHGRKQKFGHQFEGVNSRLDGLQAAVLNVKLKHLENWTARRREVARMYDEGLKGAVVTPASMDDSRHVYHLYVVRVKEREKVRTFLSERGISTGIHYPTPLPFLEAYRYLDHRTTDFPIANAYKEEILSLPMHGDLTNEQVGFVIQSIRDAVAK